jgi:hypothetical protein
LRWFRGPTDGRSSDPSPSSPPPIGSAADDYNAARAKGVPTDGRRGVGFGATELSDEDRLKDAVRTAREIVVCGVAPRSFVDFLQDTALANAQVDRFPWRKIVYVTPETNMVLANRGDHHLGQVLLRWTSAINGIRNCARQVSTDLQERGRDGSEFQLDLREMRELYLEVVIVVADQYGAEQMWTTVGPPLGRDDPPYRMIPSGTILFDQVRKAVDRLVDASSPMVSRQIRVDPQELATIIPVDRPLDEFPSIELTGLDHFGTPIAPGTCLPAAIVVLRSLIGGHGVVLLKERTLYSDSDEFGKLSLFSARVMEEDVASSLGLPLFSYLDPSDAIDRMWREHGQPGPLTVPLEAFIRAAQRDIYIATGLDIEVDRFAMRGCHLIERDAGCYLLFCAFEVVLDRHKMDELQLATSWNRDHLKVVEEHSVYAREYIGRLNNFLLARRTWLEQKIFARPLGRQGSPEDSAA